MAKKDIITDEIESVESEAPVQEAKKSAPKSPRKYAPDDQIPCRSITYVEFQDLQALRSTHSSYLYRPRIVIEDEELVEQWGKDFSDLYDSIVSVDVEDLFKLPVGKFKTALKKAPKGVQQAVKNIAGEKILNGSLDSLTKIKAIDEVLGTDLKLYLS